jgi:hypothetical protein
MHPGAAIVPHTVGGGAIGGSFLTVVAFLVGSWFSTDPAVVFQGLQTCGALLSHARSELAECRIASDVAGDFADSDYVEGPSVDEPFAELGFGSLKFSFHYAESRDVLIGAGVGGVLGFTPWLFLLAGHVIAETCSCFGQAWAHGRGKCRRKPQRVRIQPLPIKKPRTQDVSVSLRPAGLRPSRGRSLSPRRGAIFDAPGWQTY